MNLTVRYFAAFREATGVAQETIDTPASNAAELFEHCRRLHPELESFDASMVAINDEMAHWESTLNDDDEVLFFPPVAGG